MCYKGNTDRDFSGEGWGMGEIASLYVEVFIESSDLTFYCKT